MALLLGLALRCCWIFAGYVADEGSGGSIYRSYMQLLSPPAHTDSILLECLLRSSLGYRVERSGGAGDDLCFAFSSNAAFLFAPVQLVYNSYRNSIFDLKVLKWGAVAVNLMLQLAIVGLLSKACKGVGSNSKRNADISTYADSIAWKVYWLSFLSVSMVDHSCLSVLESFLVVAVVCLSRTIIAIKPLVQLAVFVVLVCLFDFGYVVLYCALLASEAGDSGYRAVLGGAINGYHKCAVIVALLSLAAHDVIFRSGVCCTSFMQAAAPLLQQARSSYQPSLGVFWYLEALQIRFFDRYFFWLRNAVPWLYLVPAYFRLKGVRYGGDILVNFALLVRCFTSGAASIYALQSTLLLVAARDLSVVTQMRFLPIIVVGIIIPILCSSFTLHFWVGVGNGNANYLFFCGLASWLFFGLFIVEYFIASLKTYDKMKE